MNTSPVRKNAAIDSSAQVPVAGSRVVFVHAHPDDEAIWTGGTIARLVRSGVDVTVITCTMGELGEVIGEPFQGLVADQSDQLGGFRVRELQESLAHLGANGLSHQPLFLGGAGCWRDSGMLGDAGNDAPRAFIHSGDIAVAQLRQLLVDINPDLVISYDSDGGYGHPDHIRAHDITVAACADDFATAWAVTDRDSLAAGLDAITVVPSQWNKSTVDDFASACGDIAVPVTGVDMSAKVAALSAHATQAWVGNGFVSVTNPEPAWGSVDGSGRAFGVWALSNLLCQPLVPVEHYVAGTATADVMAAVFGVDVEGSEAGE